MRPPDAPLTGSHRIAQPTATARPLGLARRAVLSRVGRVKEGSIVLREGETVHRFGDPDAPPELSADIRIHDDAVWTDVLTRGMLGAGEAYAAGGWTADNLTAVVRFFVRNRHIMEALNGGLARASRLALRGLLALGRNTRRRNRRDIAFHYDLGNAFFAAFLDETMTYSSGIFEHPDATLAEASTAKYERLCQMLDLRPGLRVLEIGCGWGGFAEHAATHHGCHVVATTISQEQFAYARERIRRAGLEDRVEIIQQDYRDLTGRYDRIASIEMIEAVGHDQLDTYVRTLSDRLEDDGLAALQAITIADQNYDQARKTVDFIKKHIFPGSFIPSVGVISRSVAANGDLRLTGLEDYGLHYAETLDRWCQRFQANADTIRGMGFPESFLRAWEYYFRYCEGGFRERYLSVVQLALAKPRHVPTR
ncbi:MAG: cyclopropane-fatty-acyl-phospholipid synthase family protein [Planctomycetota bacterium]|nr:cyclopropane-fatty-acyl-phospholipid synthase family protein [Planctomycetota bacterium]